MTLRPAMLFAVVLSASGIASASGQEPTGKITPVGDCLVARNVTAWGVVDDRRLVVKSLGKRYYDIRLSHACPALVRRPFLAFRDGMQPLPPGSARGFRRGLGSDPVTTDGRICGDIGDAIVPMGGLRDGLERPCDIRAMRRIDEATFERVFELDPATANEMLDAAPGASRQIAAD